MQSHLIKCWWCSCVVEVGSPPEMTSSQSFSDCLSSWGVVYSILHRRSDSRLVIIPSDRKTKDCINSENYNSQWWARNRSTGILDEDTVSEISIPVRQEKSRIQGFFFFNVKKLSLNILSSRYSYRDWAVLQFLIYVKLTRLKSKCPDSCTSKGETALFCFVCGNFA